QPGAPGCVDIGGTGAAGPTCRGHTENSPYTNDISYPLHYPPQQALGGFLRGGRGEFVGFILQKPPRGWASGNQLTPPPYPSGTSPSGTQSVVFEMYDDTGAHPVTGFKAFNYDLGTHTAITFDTIFKPGADPVAALDPIVQRFMDRHWEGYERPAPQNTLGAK